MTPSRALQETSHIVFVTSPRNLLLVGEFVTTTLVSIENNFRFLLSPCPTQILRSRWLIFLLNLLLLIIKEKINKRNHNKLFVSVPNQISSSGTTEIVKVFLQIENLVKNMLDVGKNRQGKLIFLNSSTKSFCETFFDILNHFWSIPKNRNFPKIVVFSYI